MTYKATLYPSGKQFSIESESSILDAAVKEKINIPHSCKDGSCGTCKTRLLKGQVNHPDNAEGISSDDLAEGYILTCVAKPQSNIEIESTYLPELDGIEAGVLPCKVETIDFPVQDVAILRLRLPPSSNFRYLPGQYIDLIHKGVQRSYSIASSEYLESGLELHIRYVPGGIFSKFIFEDLKVQCLLRLNGPHGTFFVRNSDVPIIFVAGGTGFAPIKAMVEQLLEEKSHRQIHIYWGISAIDFLYTDLPHLWQKNNDNITFTPVFSGEGVNWQGRMGMVHHAVMDDFTDLSQFEVYACGSLAMIVATRNALLKKNLLEESFFSDAFIPSKQTN